MNEMQLQSPTFACAPQRRRFKSGPTRLAMLLVLPAIGLGLLALAAVPSGPRARSNEAENRAVTDCLRGGPVATPSRSLQESLSDRDFIPSHHHPLLGRPAPDFELADPDGKVWKLGELHDGAPLVLIFYYGGHCVSCIRHLSEINRDLPLFREIGARVVGISADPPELTRERFGQSGSFGFPLLSDPENRVAHAYRVFKRAPDGTDLFRHGTVIIGRNGTIEWINVGDAPFRRNPALLYQLATMQGRLPAGQ